MTEKNSISMSVIRRLPRYYRYLGELEKAGVSKISSKELSARMGFTASQIRQDFNCFGGFGQQGYGYMVSQLRSTIGDILGVSQKRKCILLGAGNLGRALLSIDYEKMGFDMIGIFETDADKIGGSIQKHTILPYSKLEKFCKDNEPDMAIICIPSPAVEKVSDDLCHFGIKAFWNFSHYDISIKHPDVYVENVHLNDSLMTIRYMIDNKE